MDPNTTLKELRTKTRELHAGATMSGGQPDGLSKDDALAIAGEMADLFDGLDTWLGNGGFPPDDWALHKSEEQWRVFCKDCAEVIECSEDLGRRIVHAEVEAKGQHRYFLQRRIHAYGEWDNVDAS